MAALPIKKHVSPEEYLAFERASEQKHEFLRGEIYLMSGARMDHIRICRNITGSLANKLRGRDCEPFQSDLRVHIPETGLYTYPDVAVVCGEPELVQDGYLDTLTNPIVIFEVLSPSTAEYDRGPKFDHYKTIGSLKEYVLVWQDAKRVARFSREDDGTWNLADFIGDGVNVELASIGCTLTMEEIFERVEF